MLESSERRLGFPQSVSGLILVAPLTHPQRMLPWVFLSLGVRPAFLRRWMSLTLAAPMAMLGLVLGLLGVGIIVGFDTATLNTEGTGLGIAAALGAAACYGVATNMAKYLAAKASWEAANACLQTHGGFGFANEYDVERKFRETRLYQVAPISTNMILSYVAEHVLGLPRSY